MESDSILQVNYKFESSIAILPITIYFLANKFATPRPDTETYNNIIGEKMSNCQSLNYHTLTLSYAKYFV